MGQDECEQEEERQREYSESSPKPKFASHLPVLCNQRGHLRCFCHKYPLIYISYLSWMSSKYFGDGKQRRAFSQVKVKAERQSAL
jgi:hypothetical protein